MERQKDEIFKKADPKYQEDKGSKSQGTEKVIGQFDSAKASNIPVFENEGAGQRIRSKDKYPDGTVELISREGLRKRGAPSIGYPR